MTDQVLEIYDDEYANTYDERFLVSEYSKQSSDFELKILKKNLNEGDKWLDVGCGTGYYLSVFPNLERWGVDISAAMLKIAESRNPTAKFINEDFREFLSQTNETWDFVSCMWTPYNYVNSLYEFDLFIENLVRVVEENGNLFIPIFDLEDIRPHTVLDYRWDSEMPGYEGAVILTSSTWTWKEKISGKEHKHLIAPQVGYFLDKLSGSFEELRVVRYPVYRPDWVSRKAILCRKKRKEQVETRITVDEDPSLYPIHNEENNDGILKTTENLSTKDLLKLLLTRFMKKLKNEK